VVLDASRVTFLPLATIVLSSLAGALVVTPSVATAGGKVWRIRYPGEMTDASRVARDTGSEGCKTNVKTAQA
jgi:hypothetical protein